MNFILSNLKIKDRLLLTVNLSADISAIRAPGEGSTL